INLDGFNEITVPQMNAESGLSPIAPWNGATVPLLPTKGQAAMSLPVARYLVAADELGARVETIRSLLQWSNLVHSRFAEMTAVVLAERWDQNRRRMLYELAQAQRRSEDAPIIA